MNLQDTQHIIASRKQELLEKYYIKSIGIFGSYARGEQRDGSDIDVLVEFDWNVDFFKFLDAEEFLANLFNRKVDLFTEANLKPFIRSYVFNDLKKVA